MYDEILDTILRMIQDHTDLPVRRAVLPVGAGVSIEKGTSDVITTSLDRSTIEEMACVLNCKDTDLQKARQVLSDAHHRLSRLAEYSNNSKWQITAIETISGPTTIGREPGNLWLVGSTIRVKFYDKEGVIYA